VLSGGAGDGAGGLCEIKAAGGITIAQAPDDAHVDGMPKAAIATGAVDIVLPADAIGAKLLELAELQPFESPDASLVASTSAAIDEDAFERLLRLLRRATGVDFTYYKRPTILRRITRRMALRRLHDLDDYVTLLQKDALEVQNLYEDVLIHVTSFFREPESFAALTEAVLPRLLRVASEGTIRIWVPGCSTGEEVYSLAISLCEALEHAERGAPIQIFGTDVSERAVQTARLGVYPDSIASEVTAQRLARFFAPVEGGYRIGKAIREHCVFARQDITRDPPFSRLDLIVCRNMLIYLGQAVQRKVMAVMNYALKPNGYLMLGRAESTGPSAELFTVVDKRSRIYVKRGGGANVELDFKLSLPDVVVQPLPKRPAAASPAKAWEVQNEADRLLISRYVPPAIVVDAAFHILGVRGHTADFLELPSGEASLDALKMVRQPLLVPLRTALQEAKAGRLPVRRDDLALLADGKLRRVSIEVIPLAGAEHPCFLVLFGDGAGAASPTESQAGTLELGSSPEARGAMDLLNRELASTREQLRANIHDLAAANEELQSANEEILSSNEELQSTNEELDTAKEELQSTNEELSTLNEELRGRNEELTVSNSDLSNLLASVQIPIVMVTDDLKIRRFTPAAERVLNLIPSDAGRPIGHINPNVNCPDLEALIAEVIQTVTAREQDVESRDGRRFSLRIRPYKSVENRIDGAVLTLVDVSAARDALVATQKTCEAIMSAVREAVVLLDAELRVTGVNRAFCDSFEVESRDAIGRSVFELGRGPWDTQELRGLLERAVSEQRSFRDFVVVSSNHGVSQRWLVDGSAVEPARSGGLIVLVARPEAARAGH
jgi:two-component system, chemotaxis family, CheB/CheR fusion protein